MNPYSRNGDESKNDWCQCVDWEECGYIGVHPNRNDNCPRCKSGLERYSGVVYVCNECEVEHIMQGDAEDCCQL